MSDIDLELPEPMKEWVEKRVREDSYSDAGAYLRDLIERDCERRSAHAELQALITEGIESGDYQPFDAAAFKARMRLEHGKS